MASPSLVVPGVLYVGEDERARVVALTGPAAGWMRPKGLLQWSNEVSVVPRAALTEEVRRDTKVVMPEEQIPPARMPLTLQAAQKSPLIAVAQRLVPKLVDKGVRVHTIGVDRITSSFYYLAEGGGEDAVRAEGDLVAAVGAMLGERADNAAIERAMDGILDRLLRALSQDRVNELAIELAASLPRAANDGTGLKDVDLDTFEKQLSQLVASSEKYKAPAEAIANAIAQTNEQRVDVPLYGDGRKVSQAPLELDLGDRKVSLPTYDRWVLTGPFREPAPKVEAKPIVEAKPLAEVKPITEPPPKAEAPSPKPAVASPKPAEAIPRPVPRPTSSPAKKEPKPDFAKPAAEKPAETAEAKAEPATPEKKAEKKPEEEEKLPVVEQDDEDEDEDDDEPDTKAKREEVTAKRRAAAPAKKKTEIPYLTIILLVVFAVVAWQIWLRQP